MNTRRYQPGGKIRSFGDQLEELCETRGLLKQDVAAEAKISPAQLSHYLKFGASLRMMERIAKVLNVPPSYFDAYVADNSGTIIAEHPELLAFMRSVLGASEPRRKLLLKGLRGLAT